MERSLDLLKDKKGFTLTELMVVIGIVGIMMGFSYAGFSDWHKREKVRGAAQQLAGKIKKARMLAMEKGTSHTLYFDVDSGTGKYRYYLFRDPSASYFNFTDLNIGIDSTDTNNNTKVDAANIATDYRGVTFATNILFTDGLASGTTNQFRFDTRGIPRVGGANSTCSGDVIFTNDSNFQCEVELSRLGRVKVECTDFF